jgi:hypothetical protein
MAISPTMTAKSLHAGESAQPAEHSFSAPANIYVANASPGGVSRQRSQMPPVASSLCPRGRNGVRTPRPARHTFNPECLGLPVASSQPLAAVRMAALSEQYQSGVGLTIAAVRRDRLACGYRKTVRRCLLTGT